MTTGRSHEEFKVTLDNEELQQVTEFVSCCIMAPNVEENKEMIESSQQKRDD